MHSSDEDQRANRLLSHHLHRQHFKKLSDCDKFEI